MSHSIIDLIVKSNFNAQSYQILKQKKCTRFFPSFWKFNSKSCHEVGGQVMAGHSLKTKLHAYYSNFQNIIKKTQKKSLKLDKWIVHQFLFLNKKHTNLLYLFLANWNFVLAGRWSGTLIIYCNSCKPLLFNYHYENYTWWMPKV